ncbi:myosin II heavy chain [Cryptosporidium sp. chipmunk genotype I]|uniref:myosin II heavy chain n=1 Tax=Cryptosporidium sp. chipmunk genotype I TaxID=1280935 RepID=UPI00351A8C8E|nr:myosin II heavy chain [Cryptosporidium sp. chipmunk genotype I]
MELNSEKNFSITGIRKKTRKAIRPGIGESNIGIGSASISRPSLMGMEKQKHEESNLSSLFSKRASFFKAEKNSETTDENKIEVLGLNFGSMGLNNKNREIIDGKCSILKKSFKEDMMAQTVVADLEDAGVQNELNSNTNCPFLVGSGSEASYERSSEIKTVIRKNRQDYECIYDEDPVSLKDLVSSLNGENMGVFGTSHDVEELSKWFSKMVSRFETFGLNIQSKLERLEQDLETNIKNLRDYSDVLEQVGVDKTTIMQEGEDNSQNEPMRISERYLELVGLKNKLLEELSNIENKIMLEEMRIKKEESERRIRIEEYKSTRQVYKDELSSLTIIICWIEDCLQKFVYPIQKKQSEYKMETSREGEILKLIQEEISKIEKQEKVVLEKLREIQEIKRYKGEEKELLEEQIQLSQASKSDKIKNANFKEASMISQTIQVLQQEVLELEDSYSSVLHQEKEFMEKIERIRKSYQDEISRMNACEHEIFLNRKQRRQQLKLKVEQLKECKFLFDSEILSENTSFILKSLSEKFYAQIHSVLSFEIGLINKHDLEDEKEHGTRKIQTQVKQVETFSQLENQQPNVAIDSESESKSEYTFEEKNPPISDSKEGTNEDHSEPRIQQKGEVSPFLDNDCNASDSDCSIDGRSGFDNKSYGSQALSCCLVDSSSTHITGKADSNMDQTTELESSSSSKKDFGVKTPIEMAPPKKKL